MSEEGKAVTATLHAATFVHANEKLQTGYSFGPGFAPMLQLPQCVISFRKIFSCSVELLSEFMLESESDTTDIFVLFLVFF